VLLLVAGDAGRAEVDATKVPLGGVFPREGIQSDLAFTPELEVLHGDVTDVDMGVGVATIAFGGEDLGADHVCLLQ
jgi:hypothetical protein